MAIGQQQIEVMVKFFHAVVTAIVEGLGGRQQIDAAWQQIHSFSSAANGCMAAGYKIQPVEGTGELVKLPLYADLNIGKVIGLHLKIVQKIIELMVAQNLHIATTLLK